MKKISPFLILCFLSISLLAQPEHTVTEDSNFEGEVYELLEHLDFSELQTDYFLDKAFPFIPLDFFDGSTHSKKVNIDHFGKICATLHGAAINNLVELPDPSTYMNARGNNSKMDTIPFVFLLYDYDRFKSDAIDNNLIDSVNGQFYDVPEPVWSALWAV